MILFEREHEQGRGRVRHKLSTELEALCGAQSQDSSLTNWATQASPEVSFNGLVWTLP